MIKISKRSFLGILGGLFAWAFAPRIETMAAPRIRDLAIDLPDWCPKGWLPELGQTITAKQYPYLFTPTAREDGRKYYPPFYGKQTVKLAYVAPGVQTELQSYGFQDNLTRNVRKYPDTKVGVSCISTTPQRWTNGRVAQAGFTTIIAVERHKFEEFYGPLEKTQKVSLLQFPDTSLIN